MNALPCEQLTSIKTTCGIASLRVGPSDKISIFQVSRLIKFGQKFYQIRSCIRSIRMHLHAVTSSTVRSSVSRSCRMRDLHAMKSSDSSRKRTRTHTRSQRGKSMFAIISTRENMATVLLRARRQQRTILSRNCHAESVLASAASSSSSS